jgi:hypothetical protein
MYSGATGQTNNIVKHQKSASLIGQQRSSRHSTTCISYSNVSLAFIVVFAKIDFVLIKLFFSILGDDEISTVARDATC